MMVFVSSAPSNCKMVLAISRRIQLHQVKSHNPSATSQLVFICEDGVSFENTQHTSSVAMKKHASLGGVVIAAKEGSWYFLVKWCTTLPSEGVEEDILLRLWSIYIDEFFVGFSPP
jgi:hypothetical protein